MAHQIDSIVPNHGNIGGVVTINGSGFGAAHGGSTVRFSPNQLATINSWSDVAIEAVVPAGTVTGTVRVVVGGLEADSPRNADFFHLDFVTYPTALIDYEFQNQKNDSDVGGLDNLLDADARDLNKVLDHLIKLQGKVGIDGSADPSSLDFKVVGKTDPITIEDFIEVNPGAAGPVHALPGFDWEPTGTGLFPVRLFPAGVDREFAFSFRVPRRVRAGSVLEIRPVFVLRAPPGAGEVVTLEAFGDLDGTALPPLAAPGNVAVDAFSAGLPFVTLPTPLRSIPVDGAPPIAPADAEVALRFQRLAAGNTYGGDLALYKILVDWVR